MGKRLVAAVGVVLLGCVLAGCGPVTPRVELSTWRFEGFDVVSYVPDDPVGLVYVFHGSGGSAKFATRVETVDSLNDLIDRGYGFVATESTERAGNRRWNVFDPSLDTNLDLARLARLQQHVVDTTTVTQATPLVGLGMSNGARFVSLWGQQWADAGYPVRAIAMYMGTIASPVTAGGGLDVPTFFVIAENDFTSPPGPIIADHLETAARGTPTDLVVAREQPLTSTRFLRIPEIDAAEADAVVAALVATGAWDGQGRRPAGVSIADAVARAGGVQLPASVLPQRSEIADQCALVLAVHQMRGDVKAQVGNFLDEHL
jgi:poly(3-hydroxybutyrate) depolymerase